MINYQVIQFWYIWGELPVITVLQKLNFISWIYRCSIFMHYRASLPSFEGSGGNYLDGAVAENPFFLSLVNIANGGQQVLAAHRRLTASGRNTLSELICSLHASHPSAAKSKLFLHPSPRIKHFIVHSILLTQTNN